MTETIINTLEAYANGIHLGSASLMPDGRWCVFMQPKERFYCGSKQQAEGVLRSFGASTIQESDGKK